MNQARRLLLAAVTVTTISAAAAVGWPRSGLGAPTKAPISQPANQAALDRIAQALDQQGRGSYANVFSGVSIDTRAGRVDLYATSPSGADSITKAAASAHPDMDTRRIASFVAPYTRHQLEQVASRLMRDHRVQQRYGITAVRVPPTAAALQVTSSADYAKGTTATDKAVRSRAVAGLRRIAGVPVTMSYQATTRAA